MYNKVKERKRDRQTKLKGIQIDRQQINRETKIATKMGERDNNKMREREGEKGEVAAKT